MKRSIRFYLLFLALGALVISCKAKKVVTDTEKDYDITTKKLVKNHYENELRFKTLAARLKIDYSDGDNSQGTTVSLRLEKGKTIWMSAPIGVVKVLITPTRVTFYNKLQNEYFDGDFSYLSQLLGTELNYEKIENLLLGKTLFDLRDDKYSFDRFSEDYRLTPQKQKDLYKILYLLNPEFYLKEQILSQPEAQRILSIKYNDFQQTNLGVYPAHINIKAEHPSGFNHILVEYKGVEFNENLRFPYKIPSGFNKIEVR
jgi:hypothetical protein